MTSEYSVNLNFNNAIPVKTNYTFKQGDKGITLNLLTKGVTTTGTTAHIVFMRSDNTSVEATLTGQSGPNYSYDILGNEFEVPGIVVADLKLYDGDDQRISTASFIFSVISDTLDGIGGGTGGYSDQLEELTQELEDTLQEYIDAFGDVGAIHPAGTYDPTTEYSPLDLVYYSTGDATYLCLVACQGETPSPSSQYWQLVVSGGGGGGTADSITYDNTVSGLTADDVQEAIDELAASSGGGTAASITYDNTVSGLTADDVQEAIDELAASSGGGTAATTTYDNTTSGLTADDVQEAIDEVCTLISNRNLLINPWFTVNQRGTSTYSTNNAYTVDRWKIGFTGTASASVSSSGITLTGNYVYISQPFESLSGLSGKTLTASILLSDNTIKTGSAIYTEGTTSKFIEEGGLTVALNANASTGLLILNTSGNALSIRAVKLELGSVSTLALDTEPDYTTELLKCKRYYRRWIMNNGTILGTAWNYSATASILSIPLEVPMRALPTASSSGSLGLQISNSSSVTVTSLSVGSISTKDIIRLDIVSSGLTANAFNVLRGMQDGSYIELSAEL